MNAKRVLIFCLLAISFTVVLAACGTPAGDMPPDTPIPQETVPPATADTTESDDEDIIDQQMEDLQIQIGDTTLTATLEDNSSVEALRELLADGPLTIDMSDYGNFEKVGPLGAALPRNDEQITTSAGDCNKTEKQLCEIGMQYTANLKQYGVTNQHDWREKNWGTRRNASWTSRIGADTVTFITANYAPEKVIARLAGIYPDATVEHWWADENAGWNSGYAKYRGGTLDGIACHSPCSRAAYETYTLCWEREYV